MRYLGVDYGDAKVGLAIGDDSFFLASPYKVIRYKTWPGLFDVLLPVLTREGIERIVVGLPMSDDERSGNQIKKVQDFITELKTKTKLPLVTYDEAMSTQQARKLTSNKNDDDVAAMVTLQAYLDGLR
ncbi:MAG: Holliday junction resolvase RuvX [bacterium]